MDLDLKDRKLLAELDLDGREGTSELGKRIGLSQEGTFYRIERLEKKGIVRGYTALLNFTALGYTGYGVYTRLHQTTKESKKSLIDKLKAHDHIYWIAEFGGQYDLAFALIATSVAHFSGMLTRIATDHSAHLKDLTPAIRVELVQFPGNTYSERETSLRRIPALVECQRCKKSTISTRPFLGLSPQMHACLRFSSPSASESPHRP